MPSEFLPLSPGHEYPAEPTAAGLDAGSAYVFVRSGTVWSQQAKLTTSDSAANDFFGNSVALSGDTALLGCLRNSAYVFVRSETVWSQQAKLTASDIYPQFLGSSVALSGDTALVGEEAGYGSTGTEAAGSAYVFVRSGTAWSQQAKLTASDSAAGDYFGNSVALSGDTALVGTYGSNGSTGSAYVFLLNDIAVEQPALTSLADGGTSAFGSVLVGSDTSLTFTIRNTGTLDLTGLGITFDGANASEFSVTTNPATTVAAAGTTTFVVRFAPTVAGSKTAAIHIASSVTGSKNPYDITLTGTATLPDINIEQPSLTTVTDGGGKDFGAVAVGSNTSLTFTIRNTGTASLSGLGITLDGANASDFSVTTNPASTVAAAGTTTFVVRFAPSVVGSKTAAIHVASNVAGSKNPYDITLTGTATAPDINVEQPALTTVSNNGAQDFGSVAVGSNTSLTFTIRNPGAANLTGLSITRDGTNSSEFTVTANPTSPVAPAGTTTFTIRFTPLETGVRTAALHIASNVINGKTPYNINLSGTSTGPGGANTAFNPNANSYVLGTTLQPDGKILMGGGFSSVGAATRNCIARLNSDGSLDNGFNPNANDWVYGMALQPDGKVIVVGSFTTVGGVSRNRIARLNSDGSLDVAFNPNANDWVYSAALQADGKILIGGRFTTVAGVNRNHIARLNSDGSLDSTFNPNLDSDVYTMAVQSDGRIVIGGGFITVGVVARNYIARLNSDGTLDAGFNPSANGNVYTAAVQSDGKVIIGGQFSTMGGTTRNYIARVNSNGTLDSGFNPNLNDVLKSLAIQTDGKVIIGGSFTTVGAAIRNFIARVNTDGTLDTAFNPNASSLVFSTAIQSDGQIIIGGDFTTIGGVASGRISRLQNNAATQSLTIPNASRLQWLRGGASPETTQVTFELSIDGGNTWAMVGAGTRSQLVTGWELTGLYLPSSGQIRARARISGGYYNSSSGLVEAVATISGLPSTPDINVEQPALTVIPNAGTKSFGNVLAGSNTSLTFTVSNPGTANLTGLGIAFDGTNATEFSVTTNPVPPLVPGGTTTFTIQFAPASAGTRTAVLHLTSNVTNGKTPYNLNLTGRALAPNGDDDADGISNATELALTALGFDPLVNNSSLLTALQNNAPGLSLYTADSVQSLALGKPLLSRDVATGHFHLSLSIEKSPNLSGWSPLLGFSPTYDPATGKFDIDITPDTSNVQFYRVLGAKP